MSSRGAVEADERRLNAFIRIATWSTVAFSVSLPAMRLYSIVLLPGVGAVPDPGTATVEMRGLVLNARRTLAQARRMVTRYRESSLEAELKAVATLLSTARIETRLEVPTELPPTLDGNAGIVLRREVARILAMANPPSPIVISVTVHGGTAQVELQAAVPAPAAGMASRLSLSPSTVRNYLSNAISKVGGRKRIDAIRIARDAAWL